VEYPQEVVEEVEEVEAAEAEEEVSLPQHQHKQQLPMEEINSLATHHLYFQEIVLNRKNSWPTGRSTVAPTKTPPACGNHMPELRCSSLTYREEIPLNG
jgi:hypothetical protein